MTTQDGHKRHDRRGRTHGGPGRTTDPHDSSRHGTARQGNPTPAPRRRGAWTRLAGGLAGLTLLGACASLDAQDIAAERATTQRTAESAAGQVAAMPPASDASLGAAGTGELVSDPLEPWNRYVFAVNDMIYTLARPWIAPYMVLPEAGKEKVDNLLHNLKTPVILLNDLLQGEFERAWITTKRFFINTTTGVLGLVDVAEKYGIPAHTEDFGQTLGTYGVGDGPYLVLPLFGPSNPRDALGQGIDMVTHPLFWLGGETGTMVTAGRTYGTVSSEYGGRVNEMDALRETSLDYYATVRSLYTQMRRGQVQNLDAQPGQAAAVDYFADPAEASR